MKHVSQEKLSKRAKGKIKKSLAASYDYENENPLVEMADLDLFFSDDTGLVYDYDGDIVGALDEDGDIISVDDLDEDWLDEAIYIDEAGTSPEKAGIRMKGSGYMGTSRTNAPMAHGGGAARGIKTRNGSPASMRGNGEMNYGEEEADESFDPYVSRLESQIARQQEVIDAFQDLQQAEALEQHKSQILGAYPELSVVESRLDRCQTVQEMREEAEALLTVVESARGTRTYGAASARVNGSSVDSVNVNGAPRADLLTESDEDGQVIGAGFGSGETDTASRVAAHRRRRLSEDQN